MDQDFAGCSGCIRDVQMVAGRWYGAMNFESTNYLKKNSC
jgi:hypothetical protein